MTPIEKILEKANHAILVIESEKNGPHAINGPAEWDGENPTNAAIKKVRKDAKELKASLRKNVPKIIRRLRSSVEQRDIAALLNEAIAYADTIANNCPLGDGHASMKGLSGEIYDQVSILCGMAYSRLDWQQKEAAFAMLGK